MSEDLLQKNVIKSRTDRSCDEVCEQVHSVCERYEFSVLSELNLAEKMKSKGVPFEGECRIYEFCNPESAAKVLDEDRDIATALPCRLAVYTNGDQGKTYISSLSPTSLIELFGATQAREEAEQIEKDVRAIVAALAS